MHSNEPIEDDTPEVSTERAGAELGLSTDPFRESSARGSTEQGAKQQLDDGAEVLPAIDSVAGLPGVAWAVLCIDRDLVEWCESNGAGVISRSAVTVSDLSTEALCKAAVAAREEAGGKAKGCTLALGPTLAPFSRLVLPVLKKKDLLSVLTRKSTRALGGSPKDARFHAQPLEGNFSSDGEGAHEGWMLTAFDAAFLRNLEVELGKVGIRCKGASSRLLVGFAHASRCLLAQQAAADQQTNTTPETARGTAKAPRVSDEQGQVTRRAHLILLVEPQGVSLGLQEGGTLQHVDRIQGDLQRDPGCAASVVQDVRSLASYFRRESRGGSVTDAIVVGLDPDPLALLSLSLKQALPGVSISSSGRVDWLREAALEGPLGARLTQRASGLARVAMGAAVALVLSGVGLTWKIHGEGQAKLEQVSTELAAYELEASDLRRGLGHIREIESKLNAAEEHLDRMAQISLRDVGLEPILERVSTVFDGRADIAAIACKVHGEGRSLISIDARTRSLAILSHGQLAEIHSALLALDGVTEVDVGLPSTIAEVDGSSNKEAGLRFRMSFLVPRLSSGGSSASDTDRSPKGSSIGDYESGAER